MTPKQQTMEQVLENTRLALKANPPATSDAFKIILPIIRRVMPKLIAEEIVGVQPMTAPVILRAKRWCPDGMWVEFERWVWGTEQDEIIEWCRENLEHLPLPSGEKNDMWFFETRTDALLFWLRYR